MTDQRQLIAFSLILSFIGLLLIFLAPSFFPAQQTSIAQLAFQPENQAVLFTGELKEVELREETASLKLCQANACVSVSADRQLGAPFLLSKGKNLTVRGKVQTYQQHVFVRAEEISLAQGGNG